MRIPLERLIDGVVETLRTAVAPAVGSRYARGQLFAAVDVLANLRDRIEEKAALLDAEAASAEAAVAAAADALRAAGLAPPPAVAPADDGPAGRAVAARAALVQAIERLASAPPDVAAPALAAIGGHLAGQALRDLQTFKVSLLNEISKG